MAFRMWMAIAALALFSCGTRPPSESAIGVTVELGSGLKANCARVYAIGSNGFEQVTDVILLEAGRSSLAVAIYGSANLSGEITVGARGYVGETCSGALALNEESAPLSVSFRDGEVVRVTVRLESVPSGMDVDADGFRAAGHAGPDCSDSNAQIFPGASERCDDLLDNDCDGSTDCAEAECDAQACDDSDSCSVGEVCSSGGCGGGTIDTCTNPPGECFAAPGTCSSAQGCTYAVNRQQPCDGGFCKSDGTCQSFVEDCGDGIDNDGNSLVDCADPDCAGQSCDDGNACTSDDSCRALNCLSGPAVTCDAPPGECFENAGVCFPDAGCRWPARPVQSSCSAGECRGDGGCGPSEVGVLCANGSDDDEDGDPDCFDSSCRSGTCSDNNACTAGESCSDAGVCSGGSEVVCGPPPACRSAPVACDVDAGCVYPVTPDQPCDGGFCTVNGQCQSPFPYTPSNFDPLEYSASERGGPYTFNCGTSMFDTTDGGFTNWCGQTPPSFYVVQQDGGPEAVVLPVKGITVNPSATFSVHGLRPLIVAVYGDASISGQLTVNAAGATPGAGGDGSFCGSSAGADGSASGNSGGGGGGGFGSAGGRGGVGADDGGAGGDGGEAINSASLVPLRGGCSGGSGGQSPGTGGGGGGALQISASGSLTVNGIVSATGAGGDGGHPNGGGGGGAGSGGAVLLEAATQALHGTITVTGGGGGEGAGQGNALGQPGENGQTTLPQPARGGEANTQRGGNGGNGGFDIDVGEDGYDGQIVGNAGGGGGGGGGGLGIIRINAADGGCSGDAGYWGIVSGSGPNCP